MISHGDVATLFLKETYPRYKGSDYEIIWIGADSVDIVWKRGLLRITRHHIHELISSLTGEEKTFNEEIDSFVSSIHPLDHIEAATHGFLSIAPKTSSWEISSLRPGNITKRSFLDSYNENQKKQIKEIWLKNFNKEDFTVKNENLLLEVISSNPRIPASHCLFSQEIMTELLKDVYDTSDKTQVLIGSKRSSILIGHEDAIERLFDIPGNLYCRKNYMKINDELWSNHNG